MFNLSSLNIHLLSATEVVGYVGFGVNMVAAVILAYALLVPYLETRRTKATYALGADFFQKFVFGNILFITNAFLSIANNALESTPQKHLYALFAVFIFVNGLGYYLNSNILRMKKANVKAAEEKGISEFEYWEKYLKNSSQA